jgi:hypothetical protein
MAVTGVSALLALILWTETFRKIYVVSAEGSRGDLVVKVDGGAPVHISKSSHGSDAPYTTIEVRTSSKHHVVAVGADGREKSYELDPASASHGWVLAPRGREQGLCLANLNMYYGTTPKEGEDKLLGREDLIPLPRSYDYVLTSPPSSIQTQNGASETRTALRALDCAALDRDQIVPFGERPH